MECGYLLLHFNIKSYQERPKILPVDTGWVGGKITENGHALPPSALRRATLITAANCDPARQNSGQLFGNPDWHDESGRVRAVPCDSEQNPLSLKMIG